MMAAPLLASLLLSFLRQAGPGLPGERAVVLECLDPVATRSGKGAESVSVQAHSARAVVANSKQGTLELFDLSRPAAPGSLAFHDLGLAKRERLTSVAFHPRHDWVAATIDAAEPMQPGRVLIVSASDGRVLARLPAGAGPDHVAFEPGGRYALVANEGEDFAFSAEGDLVSAPGSLTRISVGPAGDEFSAEQIALSCGAVPGLTRLEDGRFLEREVEGETRSIPVDGALPELFEPEGVAFTPDGKRGFVTLQENNGIACIDVEAGRVTGLFGLHTTSHLADVARDGAVRLDTMLTALREPDGLALSDGGRFLVTADEGDTLPKTSDRLPGKPAGGGRTLSVLDSATGEVLGDTGAQLDQRCVELGLYSDERSDNKGCEPEMVVCFASAGRDFAVVTLERADALALVDLADPAHPMVVAVCSIGAGGPHEPEGLALYRDAALGTHFVYCANEKSGLLGVARAGP